MNNFDSFYKWLKENDYYSGLVKLLEQNKMVLNNSTNTNIIYKEVIE